MAVLPFGAPHSAPAIGPYVDPERLAAALTDLAWAPLGLAESRHRALSPRLPHALVLHLAHAERVERERGVGERAPSADRLAEWVGGAGGVVATALEALEAAGVLDAGGRVATILHAPPPVARAMEAVAWGRVAESTVGAPSAWVLAHHLAAMAGAGEWVPLSRQRLERALGCGTSGLRAALDRLEAGGVLERRAQPGGVSSYRFAPAVCDVRAMRAMGERGAGEGSMTAASRPAGRVVAAPVPSTGPARGAGAVHPMAEVGVRLSVGGVELEVPAGMRVVVGTGADGRPTIAIVPRDA